MKSVEVAGKRVPVVKGLSIAEFSSGRHGVMEAGTYYFWAAVCLETNGNTRAITGRARKHLDAGERFRRIGKETKIAASKEDRKEYKKLWKILQSPLYVRPATPGEVGRWLYTHPEDAPYLDSLKFKKS